jgi:hypothetical protein
MDVPSGTHEHDLDVKVGRSHGRTTNSSPCAHLRYVVFQPISRQEVNSSEQKKKKQKMTPKTEYFVQVSLVKWRNVISKLFEYLFFSGKCMFPA